MIYVRTCEKESVRTMIIQRNCKFCNKLFYADNRFIKYESSKRRRCVNNVRVFCSQECCNKQKQIDRTVIKNCGNCNKEIKRELN